MTGAPLRTLLLGLVGNGIGASRSPAMHMAAASRLGLPCLYRLFEMTDPRRANATLAQMLDAAERAGFDGLNLTHPYKMQACALVDRLSDEARDVGAINTVLFRQDVREGHNTDLAGFRESAREGLVGANMDFVLLLGAGGAGGAVAHALADLGTRQLALADPDAARASALIERLQRTRPRLAVRPVADPASLCRTAPPDGIVNASPVGMASHPGLPVDSRCLAHRPWVADLVYFPADTALLLKAADSGCRILRGTGMALHQAAAAFRLFSGEMPDLEAMRSALGAGARAGSAP